MKIVVGIDQSYQRTGISIAVDGQLKIVKSVTLKGDNTLKRQKIAQVIKSIIIKNKDKGKLIIILERIRLFSQGFINQNYLKSIGALVAVIVDVAYEYGIKVYSVDTRAWKAAVLGTSKTGKPMTGVIKGKEQAVRKLIRMGYKDSIKYVTSRGNVKYDDDAADSACIALYGFTQDQKLKLEK